MDLASAELFRVHLLISANWLCLFPRIIRLELDFCGVKFDSVVLARIERLKKIFFLRQFAAKLIVNFSFRGFIEGLLDVHPVA